MDPRKLIETDLGRTPTAVECAKIPRLSDLSPVQLDVLRMLAARSCRTATFYLMEIADVGRRLAAGFAEEVGLRGQDPREWEYRDLLCFPPAAMVSGSVSKSVDELLSPVLSLGAAVMRQRPDLASWRSGQLFACPGVVVSNVDRGWTVPAGVGTLTLRGSLVTLEPVTDIVVATRRWVASVVARKLDPQWRQAPDVDALLALLGIAPDAVSADGRAALTGLLREASLPDDKVPGFAGPDDWYA